MVNMERYDAGLLNGYGGGNVDWWFDYIRAEIERCNDHWEEQNALLAAEVERLREALVPAMEWVRQNGIDGNIGMLDAFAAAEIIRELAAGLIGPAHNFQEICNAQNRPPSATEREHL